MLTGAVIGFIVWALLVAAALWTEKTDVLFMIDTGKCLLAFAVLVGLGFSIGYFLQ